MGRYVVAAFGIFVAGCGGAGDIQPPSVRTWTSGSFVVEPYRDGDELGVRVRGIKFEQADGLHVKYVLSLRQSESPDAFLASGEGPLAAFQNREGTGTSDYRAILARSGFDAKRPYEAVFDYELWRGKPGAGELLAKSSVISEPIGPSP